MHLKRRISLKVMHYNLKSQCKCYSYGRNCIPHVITQSIPSSVKVRWHGYLQVWRERYDFWDVIVLLKLWRQYVLHTKGSEENQLWMCNVRLHMLMWRENILETHSREEKDILIVRKSGYKWGCVQGGWCLCRI